MPRLLSLALLARRPCRVAACSHPDARAGRAARRHRARACRSAFPMRASSPTAIPALMIQEGMRALEREIATLRAEGKNSDADQSAAGLLPRGLGRRRQRRVRRRPAERLERDRHAAGVQDGDRCQHRRPDRALRLPRAELRRGLARGLHDHDPRRASSGRAASRAALFDDAMADTSPLADVIAKYADEKMFAAIAREYGEGRLLLIGTTDLDAQRPVIWNIGALAASGKPEALELFRKILRASAAIPGVFQPVMIDVELDGKQIPGDACRRRRHRPALPLSADARGRPPAEARAPSPTSSATPGSIPTTPWPSAGPSPSPAAPSTPCWPPAATTTCCAPTSSASATASTTTSPT